VVAVVVATAGVEETDPTIGKGKGEGAAAEGDKAEESVEVAVPMAVEGTELPCGLPRVNLLTTRESSNPPCGGTTPSPKVRHETAVWPIRAHTCPTHVSGH
jgi:hypothetical protein